MIKSLHLKNFQSHRDSYLEFVPGINVIRGITQAGKSALLRSLLWVTTNRPSGDHFKSHGATDEKGVSVTVGVETPVTLRRTAKGKSEYKVGKEVYKGFGTKIPEPVSTTLELVPYLNIQEQHDRPFLITDTPGEVGRVINKVTQLERVQEWIKELGTRLTRARTTQEQVQSDLVQIENILKQYAPLADFKILIDKLYKTMKVCLKVDTDAQGIAVLLRSIGEIEQDMQEFSGVEKSLNKPLVALEQLIEELNTLSNAELVLEEVMNIGNTIIELKANLESDKKELIELLQELGRCPFCLSELGEDEIEHLITHI